MCILNIESAHWNVGLCRKGEAVKVELRLPSLEGSVHFCTFRVDTGLQFSQKSVLLKMIVKGGAKGSFLLGTKV